MSIKKTKKTLQKIASGHGESGFPVSKLTSTFESVGGRVEYVGRKKVLIFDDMKANIGTGGHIDLGHGNRTLQKMAKMALEKL